MGHPTVSPALIVGLDLVEEARGAQVPAQEQSCRAARKAETLRLVLDAHPQGSLVTVSLLSKT